LLDQIFANSEEAGMPVAEEHHPGEDHDTQTGLLGHRSSRRQMLKGAALTGAGVVWAVPVVESLMTRTAAAASAPPSQQPPPQPAATFPSWAYVLYTTATSASDISSSNLFVAGYQNDGTSIGQAFAANPHPGLTSPSETVLGASIVMAIGTAHPGPVPVTASVNGGSAITATPEYPPVPLTLTSTQQAVTISPSNSVTILGAFYFTAGSVQFQPVVNGSVAL